MAAELPDDLAALLKRLDESDHRARALIAEVDEERFNWQPDERSWSVAQCLDHLNVGNHVYLGAMRPAVVQARERNSSRRGPIRPRVLEGWFIRSLEPRAGPRLKAPRKIVPAARKSRAEVGEQWERVQAELRELLHAAAPLDLNRTRFINPFIPLLRWSVGTGFLALDAHERRHIWQAEQVRARFDQPSTTSS